MKAPVLWTPRARQRSDPQGILDIIRRMALREKQLIREISRHTGLLCNTIAKYRTLVRSSRRITIPERQSKFD
jgi:hypothetical protein